MTAARERADKLLVARGLAATRAKAQELIRRGRVQLDGAPLHRSGVFLEPDARLTVTPAPFVSRGGEKLDHAIGVLGVEVKDRVVVDVGASTGGFTDCVLTRGARKVYAVDVGRDQLDPKLRAHPAVVSREGTNARDLTNRDFDEPIDLVLVDASFIGLGKLLPAIAGILPAGGRLLALVKPQFEVGPEAARRARGVVRDPRMRAAAIRDARVDVERHGFVMLGAVDSTLAGPKGNVEHFLYAERRMGEPA